MFPFVFSFRGAEGYGGRGWNQISGGQVFMKNELAQINELRHVTDEKNNIRETIRLLTESQTRIALRLYYSGSESCAPGHFFGPAVRTHYLIHFIRSGKGRYMRGNSEYALKKGDAFLILPGETTKYMADEEAPWEYTWIAFDGPDAGTLLRHCGFTDSQVVYRAPDEESAQRLLTQTIVFEDSFHENSQNLLEILGNFYLLFSCMYQEQLPAHLLPESGNAAQTGSLQEIYFRQAVEYLEHNFSYPVKIEQLARQVGVSRTYLYKIFISHSGKSVQQYLLDLRLEAAMDMLKKTRRDITEIAYSCGFTDSPSFCRQFKKTTGRTPLQYRRLAGNYGG